MRVSVLCLAGLLLAGCSRPAHGPAPEVKPATAQEIRQAMAAPGAKAVLVNLWASWCAPCRAEFPDLVKLQKDYAARGLRVVFVSWDDSPEIAARFLAKQGVTEPSFIKSDAEGDIAFLSGIDERLTGALPSTLVYDAAGRLRWWHEGTATYAEFESKVLEALNSKAEETKQ